LLARCAVHGIAVHVCGCKNPDLTHGRCHLIRPGPANQASMARLF
jgi:hypothetical protein